MKKLSGKGGSPDKVLNHGFACFDICVVVYLFRGLALGIALTVYGREEEADTLIEQMTRDQDPILRYGGMYALALAYRGTANNKAIRQLLHFAVSDVSDDVRRTAVLALGFVLYSDPEQVSTIFFYDIPLFFILFSVVVCFPGKFVETLLHFYNCRPHELFPSYQSLTILMFDMERPLLWAFPVLVQVSVRLYLCWSL